MTVRTGAGGTIVDSTLSVDSDGALVAFVDFDGAGALSSRGNLVELAQANLSGTGALSPDGLVVKFGDVRFDGVGGLSANGITVKFAEVLFGGTGNLSADAVQNSGSVVEYLRPDADDADGSWTNELDGTDLFPSIDESAPDDNDFIKSIGNPVADIARFRLSNPIGGATSPAKVRIRYKKTGTDAIDLTVRLKQGASEIASWVYTDIADTFLTATETLTGPQFAAITDFNDLFIELQADS